MEICYLDDAFSPQVRKFMEYFSKTENEICIISLRNAKYRNATVYLIPQRTPFKDVDYFLSFLWLRKIIESIHLDILHAHFFSSFALLGTLVGFHPYVVTVWGSHL